jgi:hypothetical protein
MPALYPATTWTAAVNRWRNRPISSPPRANDETPAPAPAKKTAARKAPAKKAAARKRAR